MSDNLLNPPESTSLEEWAAYLKTILASSSEDEIADALSGLVELTRESDRLDGYYESNENYPFLMLGGSPMLITSPEVKTLLSDFGDSLIERDYVEDASIQVLSTSRNSNHQQVVITLEVTSRPESEMMFDSNFVLDDEDDDGGEVVDGDDEEERPDGVIPPMQDEDDEDTI